MIGDDLVPFFGQNPPDSGFRQGEIITFDVFTGVGSVRVGGSVLTDVQFLTPAGQVSYLPGDAVLLVRYRSSWAILGRYRTPSTDAAIGRYTEFTGAYQGTPAANFTVGTSYAAVTTLNLPSPSWSRVVTGTVSFMVLAKNTGAAEDFINARILVAGTSWAGHVSATIPTLKFGSVTVTAHFQIVVPSPGSNLAIVGEIASTAAAWSAHTSNFAHVQATAAWNSNLG